MNRQKIKKLLAVSGGSLVAALSFLPVPASAFPGVTPCTMLGAPYMPPPCRVVDMKKLTDIATKYAQDIEKKRETIKNIEQAKAATDGIMADVKSLKNIKLDIALPDIDTNMGPLFSGQAPSSISALAEKTSNAIFSGVDGTTAKVQAAQEERSKIVRDGIAEAFAYGAVKNDIANDFSQRQSELAAKACRAKDLRGDWAVNSEIKLEVMNARTKQAELMAAVLKLNSSINTGRMKAEGGEGYSSSETINVSLPKIDPIDQSFRVKDLMDILAQAQKIFAGIQIVQMTKSAKDSLQEVITDAENTSARKQAKINEINSYASSWVRNSKRCSPQMILDTTISRLGSMNGQMAELAKTPEGQLSPKVFSDRKITAQDLEKMKEYDIDPRAFIGSWLDPLNYDNTHKLVDELLSDKNKGALSSCIEGDDDNREFKNLVGGTSYEDKSKPSNDPNRYVYVPGLNDLILEEAWKNEEAAKARAQIAEAEQTINQENADQGKAITTETAVADLQALIARANILGQEISNGKDEGSKQVAGELLTRLQNLVGGGVGLPSVDASLPSVGIDGGNGGEIQGPVIPERFVPLPDEGTPVRPPITVPEQ
jgi:hypothetical protein